MSESRDMTGPVLLCFDGSADAAAAIATAGALLPPRAAVVVTVWEPAAGWVPYDPVTIVTAPLDRLVARFADLDEAFAEAARETLARGVKLASDAGFKAEGELVEGKPWRVICRLAEEIAADPVVVGARGLGRVESALLGSVSSAVLSHARRPVLVVPTHADD